MESTRYREWREPIEQRLATMIALDDEAEIHRSPSGNYFLRITEYTSGPCSWSYSRGVVFRTGTGTVVADVIRNYGMFWHAWVVVEGREYLLCGEDYQGYNVVDLDSGTNSFTFPEEAYEGHGFCWAAVYPSPDGKTLAVEGCYWACPYEVVFIDFSEPGRSLLPELERFGELDRIDGWGKEGEFRFSLEEEGGQTRRVWRREPA